MKLLADHEIQYVKEREKRMVSDDYLVGPHRNSVYVTTALEGPFLIEASETIYDTREWQCSVSTSFGT